MLEQTETPGLRAKLAEEGNPCPCKVFSAKSPAEVKMSVRKDGGDIDAITASTISSRAYIQAVSLAYTAFLEVRAGRMLGWDASSGATSSRQVREAEAATSDSASGATGRNEEADTASGATVGRHGGRNGYGVCFCGCCRRYGFRSHAADGEHRCLVGRHIFLCESCFG